MTIPELPYRHCCSIGGWNYKRTLAYLSLALAVNMFYAACTPTPIPSSPKIKEATPEDKQITALNIAVIPARKSAAYEENFKRFTDYLQKSLGLPVKLQLTKDYDTAVDLIVEGKVEMAYLGPLSYVKARKRNPHIEPIVAHISKGTGRPWYTSAIVANTKAGINSLHDLKGKHFSFANQLSTSGYLVPKAEFKRIGFQPERDFAAIEYSGSHNKSIEALVSGNVDAIAIDHLIYLEAKQSGQLPPEKYKVIWESEPIPNSPIVISSHLPPQLKTELKKALINTTDTIVNVDGDETLGYTSVQDEDYEPIREVQKLLESQAD